MTAMAPGALLAMLGTLMMAPTAGYPRIASLWGCSPASHDVEAWSRYDLLICAGGTAADWRRFARETREQNPGLILLGTAPLMNIGPPKSTPWMRPEWYLYRPDGSPVNWWAGQVYAPNLSITECRAALLSQTEETYGDLLNEAVLSGVFYDSVVGGATWYGEVDADRDGVADGQAGPQGEGGQGLVGAGDFPEEGHVDAFIPVRILVDQEGNRLALAQQAQDVHCRVALGNGPVAAP